MTESVPNRPFEDSEFDQVERASRRRRRVIWVSIAVAAVVVIVVIVSVFAEISPQRAVVGSCVTGFSAEDLQVVDCSSSAAHMKVVGRLSAPSESSQAAMEAECAPYPTTLAVYYDLKNHFVLCLAPRG